MVSGWQEERTLTGELQPRAYATFFRRARDDGVPESCADSRNRHGSLHDRPKHLSRNTETEEQFLFLRYPARKTERHEKGESDDEHVPLAAHIGTHEHLYPQGTDGTEKGDVGAADDGARHCGDESSQFADHAHENEKDGAGPHYPSGRHTGETDEPDVFRVGGRSHGTQGSCKGTVHPLRADTATDHLRRGILESRCVGTGMIVTYGFDHDREKPRHDGTEGNNAELRRTPGQKPGEFEPGRGSDARHGHVCRMPLWEKSNGASNETDQVGKDNGRKDGKNIEILVPAHETEEENSRHDQERYRPVIRRVELHRHIVQGKADGHDGRADDHRSDDLPDDSDEATVADDGENHTADDESPPQVLHDHLGPHRLVDPYNGHDGRNEAETGTLNDRKACSQFGVRLNERGDPHGEIDAGNEETDLYRIHPHRRPENERNERGRPEEGQHMLGSRKDQDRKGWFVEKSVNDLFACHWN